MNYNNLEGNKVASADCWPHRKISWRGILAGTVTALILEALLNILGLGIGLVSFVPDKEIATGIGIGSAIWLILVSIISLFVAGWVAAISSGKIFNKVGALQGFVTWGLSSLIVLFMITTTGSAILGGASTLIGKGFKSAENMAMNKKSKDKTLRISGLYPLQERLKPGISNEKMVDDVTDTVKAYAAADNDQEKKDARQHLSWVISQNTDLTPQEVEQKTADVEASYEKMKEKAKEAIKTTTNVAGSIAIIVFFSFLLGAIAAIVGGIVGAAKNRCIEARKERVNHL